MLYPEPYELAISFCTLKRFKDLFILCVCACLHVYIYAYTMCVQCPQRSKDGIRCPRAGIKNGCAPSCGYWEPNMGLVQEQQVLLTTVFSL